MFLNDVSLRFRWSERCCYPSCLLPSFPVHRSRFPVPGVHALIGVKRPFKPSNLIPGAIVPDRHVKPLATPYSAVYGVWLASSRGVPVDTAPCGGGVPVVRGGARRPAWGSGVLPTVGRGRWWALPHYRGAPMVGCPLQWGWVDSGCFPTIGVAGLWVSADSGLVPTIKALSDVALTFK